MSSSNSPDYSKEGSRAPSKQCSSTKLATVDAACDIKPATAGAASDNISVASGRKNDHHHDSKDNNYTPKQGTNFVEPIQQEQDPAPDDDANNDDDGDIAASEGLSEAFSIGQLKNRKIDGTEFGPEDEEEESSASSFAFSASSAALRAASLAALMAACFLLELVAFGSSTFFGVTSMFSSSSSEESLLLLLLLLSEEWLHNETLFSCSFCLINFKKWFGPGTVARENFFLISFSRDEADFENPSCCRR